MDSGLGLDDTSSTQYHNYFKWSVMIREWSHISEVPSIHALDQLRVSLSMMKFQLFFYGITLLVKTKLTGKICTWTCTSVLFSFHVPSTNMEKAGFMTYNAASHKEVIKNVLTWGAVMSSIFIYSLWKKIVWRLIITQSCLSFYLWPVYNISNSIFLPDKKMQWAKKNVIWYYNIG